VTASASACLDAHCASLCGSMVVMGGMCPDMTSTGSGTGSSSSSGGPSCTPGPNPAAQSCYSDADCESCHCNVQTMLCE
jgi:hypothetical protein